MLITSMLPLVKNLSPNPKTAPSTMPDNTKGNKAALLKLTRILLSFSVSPTPSNAAASDVLPIQPTHPKNIPNTPKAMKLYSVEAACTVMRGPATASAFFC